jgi:hypothetical protein
MNWLTTAILSVILVELLIRLPLRGPVTDAAGIATKARHTMLARAISDHWKERALLAYARRLFSSTMRLALVLAAFFLLAALLVLLAESAGVLEPGFLFGWIGILYSLVLATAYATVRRFVA